MAGTALKIGNLTDEDDEMREALAVVLETADEKGVVQWSDISDDLTSDQWGRLIQKEVLVDAAGQGFVVDDPEAVRDALELEDSDDEEDDEVPLDTEDETDAEDIEDEGWSTYDKAAALLVAPLFLGYSQKPIRSAVGNTLNVIFGPIESAMPFYAVILSMAVLTATTSGLLQSKLMNMEKMGKYQEQMQAIQEKRKEAKERGDDEALEQIKEEQMEAMGDQLGMFKEQFRPMVWIMLVNIPLFLWMYWLTIDGHVVTTAPVMILPVVGEISSWTARVGPTWMWLIWYFVASFSLGQIVRKSLNFQTTPNTS
jgi:uncharacterized membrane protein (DUF106 family)